MARVQAAPCPATPPLATHYLYRRWGFLIERTTRVIAALEALLQDPAAPYHRIQGTVDLMTRKQTELRALDAKIQAELPDEAFEADFAIAWDYEDNIAKILARALPAA